MLKLKKIEKHLFNRVAIIGLGLMGASLGLALKKTRITKTVAGFARRPETRKKALAGKIIDVACERIEDAVRGSDFIVLCAPISVIPGMMKSVSRGELPQGAIVTDVGSVKSHIVAEAEKTFWSGKAEFIGSHPIAGSEQQGLESAHADLYHGVVVALTPTSRTSEKALLVASKFWRALGADIVAVSPAEHDRVIARTSHLPHVIAALLSGSVGRGRTGRYAGFCGTGFRDTTRIAEGDPVLWRDIIEDNAPNLLIELSAFAKELKKIIAGLKKGRSGVAERCLSRGRECRRRLLAKKDTKG